MLRVRILEVASPNLNVERAFANRSTRRPGFVGVSVGYQGVVGSARLGMGLGIMLCTTYAPKLNALDED